MPRKKQQKPDRILLSVFVALAVIGLVALMSASIPQSQEDYGNIYGYVVHQLFFGFFLGGLGGLVLYKMPYQKLRSFAPFIFMGAIFLMLLVFVPGVSKSIGGAQRWISFAGFSFQPSELVKLAFVVYLAAWLSTHHTKIRDSASFIPFAVLLSFLGILLMLQPDMSTLGIIVATAMAMYFVAGARLRSIAALLSAGIAALYIFIKIAPYRMNRIITFLNPRTDPLGVGYQINQLTIAVGAGQLFGAGPLQGTQKSVLPVAMSDSVYAVWAEETGFIGSIVLIALFGLLAWRGFFIVRTIRDHFAKFLAAGITTWLFVQAFVNMGAVAGVLPLTGVTLPFISFGSSSLVVTLMAAGLLLQLSRQTR